jgi:CheY-like chemotaxis protein/DNA-binding XRE family transcriptional regulator
LYVASEAILLKRMLSHSIVKRFGASVRKLRFRLGISQEALAERADLHRTYIADIERGARNVTLKSIDRLAKALEVSTADLLRQTCQVGTHSTQYLGQPPPGELADILLVEDGPNDVELTLLAFKRAKIANRIHVVRDGEQALEYLFRTGKYAQRVEQGPPPVILLDLNLPKVSGMEVLARLKGDPRTQRISVIVLTISQNSPDIQESRRLGADAYIVKPVNFQSFSRVTPQLRLLWALLHPALVTGGGS